MFVIYDKNSTFVVCKIFNRMRQSWIKIIRAYFVPVCALVLSACGAEDFKAPDVGPQEVGFYVGDGTDTRTEMLPNGLSAVWTAGDELAVWARNSAGDFTLSNQVFKTYGIDGQHGYFTSMLNYVMPDDTYTYYCTYPVPESVSGTKVTFNLPAVQDGKVSGGADIMIATPVQRGALTPVPDPEDHSGMSMKMNRMMHQFRFYVPQDDTWLGDEAIEKLEVSFPKDVVGKVGYDYADLSLSSTLSNSSRSVTLKLADPISVTYRDQYDYACMAINPTSFSTDESMTLRAYTATRILFIDSVDLQARTFEAGHSTPVKLKIVDAIDYGRVFFTVSANDLGENANSITLTAPVGCVWGNTGSNVYTYSPGTEINAGDRFEIMFEDIDSYRSLSNRDITVTFDTEHVNTSQTIRMPDMSSGHIAEISAAMPYLLYEDFSGVSSFSSNDAYGTSSAGNKDAIAFLNGWTGGRIGAEAGKCIRIACRRETSSDYDARVDSAPIIQLKKPAKVRVTFDYGMNNQYGGISIITNPDVGQTFFVGYVTSTEGYKSGSTTGQFESGNSLYVFEKTGSYDSTPNTGTYFLNDVPKGTVRITWRTEVQHQAGANNTTCWLYIDNVKVQIAK